MMKKHGLLTLLSLFKLQPFRSVRKRVKNTAASFPLEKAHIYKNEKKQWQRKRQAFRYFCHTAASAVL